MLCFIPHPDTWKLMSRYWRKTLLKNFCRQQEEPTDYWLAVLSKMCNEVFPKSVHVLGIPLLYQLIWMVCGPEGPGVECKVRACVNRTLIHWLHHQHFPRCWCCISCCMLRSWKSRKRGNVTKDMQQYLFVSKARNSGIHILYEMRDFSIPLAAKNLFTK